MHIFNLKKLLYLCWSTTINTMKFIVIHAFNPTNHIWRGINNSTKLLLPLFKKQTKNKFWSLLVFIAKMNFYVFTGFWSLNLPFTAQLCDVEDVIYISDLMKSLWSLSTKKAWQLSEFPLCILNCKGSDRKTLLLPQYCSLLERKEPFL